jgi:putative transcriptional regulator
LNLGSGFISGQPYPSLAKVQGWAGLFVFPQTRQEGFALFVSERYTAHMQAVSRLPVYYLRMASTTSPLKSLREAAGISQRELARLINVPQTNLSLWERTGQPPRADLLPTIANALGVSVEELLGQPKPKRGLPPAGRARQLFEALSKLPRRQQDKILDILEPFIAQHSGGSKAA